MQSERAREEAGPCTTLSCNSVASTIRYDEVSDPETQPGDCLMAAMSFFYRDWTSTQNRKIK